MPESESPRWIVDPDTDCWLWQGATIGGTPVVTRGGKHVTVRRWMTPDLKRGEVIRLSCGRPLCVNPAHFVRQQTKRQAWGTARRDARGLLNQHGMPSARAYRIEPSGCHVWLGARSPQGTPEATWQGKTVNVRAVMLHAPPRAKTRDICGNPACVNLTHLFIEEGVRERAHLALVAKEMSRPPTQRRNMRVATVRADFTRLVAEQVKRGAPADVPARDWSLALKTLDGAAFADLARAEGVTKQTIGRRLGRVDTTLRRQEETRRPGVALQRTRLSATMSLVDVGNGTEGAPMKTWRVYVPATVTIRTPQTWSAKRVARELSEAVVVRRDGGSKFRPSDVLKITTDIVVEEDVVDLGEDRAAQIPA